MTVFTSITLRPVTISDLLIFFKHQNESEAKAMVAFTSRNILAFAVHWKKIMSRDTYILRTIEVNGYVAGHLNSYLIQNDRQVGYWLGREFWGKGIATQALTEFLKIIETRPLYARVAKHNPGSKRVLEKCGFVVIRDEKRRNRANEEVDEFVLRLGEDER